MCGSWAFHSAEFYLIRAGSEKLWRVNISLCETQNGMKNSLSVSQYSI